MSTVDVEIIIQPKGRGKPRREARTAPATASPQIPRIARLMARVCHQVKRRKSRQLTDSGIRASMHGGTEAREPPAPSRAESRTPPSPAAAAPPIFVQLG